MSDTAPDKAASANPDNPEIARSVQAAGITTNYHDVGDGFPALFIHGSGPGVSAWANWRLVMPALSERLRVIAPDMAGFGFSERPAGIRYDLDTWVAQAIGLLDALGLEQADVVGNSFGGALALAMAIRHPQRVRRLVLMGSVGVPFDITEGLDAVWGYTPSFENMRRIMDYFAWDRSLVNDELAELRYRASIRPGFQESFGAMFPAPRQRWVDALASREERDPDRAWARRSGDSAAHLAEAGGVDRSIAVACVRSLRPLDADRARRALRETGW